MHRTLTAGAIAVLLFMVTTAQGKQASRATNKPQPLPRDLETQLALSALPPHLRDQATVYVLNPDKGFEIARHGTNDFHTLVARTGDDAMRGSWTLKDYRDDILYPISFDGAGAKEQLRVFLDIAEMQAKGTPARELKKLIQDRYRTNYYHPPERAGVSYMLAPIVRGYTNPDVNDDVATLNFPHIMHYAPNISPGDIGAAPIKPADLQFITEHGHWQTTPYPFLILHGPHGYMVQPIGQAEAAAITKQYQPMLTRLCQMKSLWCLKS